MSQIVQMPNDFNVNNNYDFDLSKKVSFGIQDLKIQTMTPFDRERVFREVAVHEQFWSQFIKTAPSAASQTGMAVYSEQYQVRCIDGSTTCYSLRYDPKMVNSKQSGYAVCFMKTICVRSVEQYKLLGSKRTSDKFNSAIANLCANGYQWN
jgi:hypothetical protein